MNLFPITTPTLALSISEDTLCLVKVKKSWRTTTLKYIQTVPLPSNTVRLSSVKPNIVNMEAFLESLRILAKPLTTPISIALSLPDLCARTSVFDFSTFPTNKTEQTALVNWRFRQDLKLDIAQSRLSYAVYVPASLSKGSTLENSDKVQVLGTAIRNEIVEQYENACLGLNLLPISISITGLDIFDLYHRHIQDILEVEERRSLTSYSGAMFLFISRWGFTFLAFHDGYPNFIRTKAISIRPISSRNQEEIDQIEPVTTEVEEEKDRGMEDQEFFMREGEHHPFSPYTITKFEKEIVATVQYYLESFNQNNSVPSRANLFVMSDLENCESLIPSTETLQKTAEVSGVNISDIQLSLLSANTAFSARENRMSQLSNLWPALPGYASLRVA